MRVPITAGTASAATGAAAPDTSTRSVAHPIANSCQAPSPSAEPSSACACWLVVGRPCSSSPPHLIAALRLPSDRRGRPRASNLGAWRESERGSSTGAVTCAGLPGHGTWALQALGPCLVLAGCTGLHIKHMTCAARHACMGMHTTCSSCVRHRTGALVFTTLCHAWSGSVLVS